MHDCIQLTCKYVQSYAPIYTSPRVCVCVCEVYKTYTHWVINLHKKKYKHYQTFIISLPFRHISWNGKRVSEWESVRGWKVIETIRATPFCGTRAFLLLLLQFQQHENLILLGAIGFKVKPMMTIKCHIS